MSGAVPVFSRHLALLGTASDVGKSVLACAFCRLLSDAGHVVAPYKAQNMSNNAAVAHDGGEMGRAQYVQAFAARVPASVHHNPVLLKPMSDTGSQVVVRGRVPFMSEARTYYEHAAALREVAHESLVELCQKHDVVVIEGAGSCAEVNLRGRDFVNFAAAEAANARVVLVADIERGGVFAQIVGSLEVMLPEERARVCGVIVNKFRGDASLFDDGVRYLEQRTRLPVLGVVPHVRGLDIDEEDSVALTRRTSVSRATAADGVRIAVIAYPHIANYTDFDALGLEAVTVEYVTQAADLAGFDAVILPGSKAVAKDLGWLRTTGLFGAVQHYHATGGKLLGVCGGLQMLGTTLEDPEGVESSPAHARAATPGLGLLELITRLGISKIVRRCHGTSVDEGAAVSGYELHHGLSTHAYAPLFVLKREVPSASAESSNAATPAFEDGVRTERIWGTYLHGLFDEPGFRHTFLRWVRPEYQAPLDPRRRVDALDEVIDRFASHVRRHIDWPQIVQWTR